MPKSVNFITFMIRYKNKQTGVSRGLKPATCPNPPETFGKNQN
jgi:hypothetical protein